MTITPAELAAMAKWLLRSRAAVLAEIEKHVAGGGPFVGQVMTALKRRAYDLGVTPVEIATAIRLGFEARK